MYQRIQKPYSTEEIKESLPFFNKKQKDDFDKEIEAVFCGKSNKFLLIIGPCSADEKDAVRRYCAELKKSATLFMTKLLLFQEYTLQSLARILEHIGECCIRRLKGKRI